MIDIGAPEDLLYIVLIEVLLVGTLDDFVEDLFGERVHIVIPELLAEEHAHDLLQVALVYLLVLVYVEDPKIELYFFIDSGVGIEEGEDLGKFCEVNVPLDAEHPDKLLVILDLVVVLLLFFL